jgi:hypothetical protein
VKVGLSAVVVLEVGLGLGGGLVLGVGLGPGVGLVLGVGLVVGVGMGTGFTPCSSILTVTGNWSGTSATMKAIR